MKKTPSTRSYTTLEEELKLHHGGGPKVCEHQREGGCFDCLEVENARLQEMQGCSACKAIHYLHPNAKQGDFSGPRHAKVGTTCSRCGEMWPCDVTELREGYARLQTDLKAAKWTLEMDDPRLLKAIQTIARLVSERDEARARAERREKELEGIRLVAQQRVGGGDFDTNHQLLRQIQRRAFDARAAIKEEVEGSDG